MPYPVICRSVFGVLGANIPAIIRGLIAVAWYGIQTYLASAALDILLVRCCPALAPYGDVTQHGFLGLSTLGYFTFALLWVLQAAVFWTGMDTIRKFIDFCGPAVYVVMFILCVYLLSKATGTSASTCRASSSPASAVITTMCAAIALVVSYFSGPMLNFGDFSRYGKSFKAVKRGNFWGLPVNFTMFSLLTVLTAAATLPVYGELITDPVKTVGKIDNTFAIVLAALTFTTATIGINIVANFVSPAFDFSHVNPQQICWRIGGMIAAVGSVLITPWNLYKNPETIHYTLDTLGAVHRPALRRAHRHYYLVHKQKVVVDDLFTMDENGRLPLHARASTRPPSWATADRRGRRDLLRVRARACNQATDYSWFIGCGLGLVVYYLLATRAGVGASSPTARATTWWWADPCGSGSSTRTPRGR